MHQTRKETTTKLPIERKGTKYVVRALSDVNNSVPVLIALRDMLKLAKTAKEVKTALKDKEIKINGKRVADCKMSIKLFNIFEVCGKTYHLSFLPTGKFTLEETKLKDTRICKVVGRRLVKGGKIQLNLHDGSNVLSKDKINTGDSVYLDFSGKIKKHLPLMKGEEAFVISGKHVGKKGKIEHLENNHVTIHFKGGDVIIEADKVIVL